MPDAPLFSAKPESIAGLPVAPESMISSKTVTESSGPASTGWVSRNLRNLVVIALTGMTCYLAYVGEDQARMALITSFTLLAGSLFGERAALKQPGKDS